MPKNEFSENGRKLFHMGYGILLGTAVIFLGKTGAIMLLGALLAIGIGAIEHRKRLHFANILLEKFSRPGEKEGRGPISFTLGALLAVSFFGPKEAAWGIIFLGIGDSLSSLVGRRFGDGERKNLFGLGACFFGNFVSGLVFSGFSPIFLAMAAFAVALVEYFAPKEVDDNLLIPGIGALFLSITGFQ